MDTKEYVLRMYDELCAAASNAARRGKPTMWAYYRDVMEHICTTYGDAMQRNDDAILDVARQVEMNARRICLVSDADYRDKARHYAYSVYARRIMRHAGHRERGWVSLWLKQETVYGGRS